jgi:hypothetical protein
MPYNTIIIIIITSPVVLLPIKYLREVEIKLKTNKQMLNLLLCLYYTEYITSFFLSHISVQQLLYHRLYQNKNANICPPYNDIQMVVYTVITALISLC